MTLLEAATAVVEARYFGKERREINEAIRSLADTIEALTDDTSIMDDLTVIRTVATPPHHPDALEAIEKIIRKVIAKLGGKEGA